MGGGPKRGLGRYGVSDGNGGRGWVRGVVLGVKRWWGCAFSTSSVTAALGRSIFGCDDLFLKR